ncbi:MAG: GDSL-type esterase/lipase family protein, partial [Verrucomicrobiota bacterium]
DLNPDHEEHTEQGFRGSEIFDPDKKETLRIACFGGSSTYGTRVNTKGSYPALMGDALRAGGWPETEVINAGVPGYNTSQIVPALAYKVATLNPRIAIFYVGFNDINIRVSYSGFQIDYSHALQVWTKPPIPLWRRSVLLDAVAVKLGSFSPRNPHINMICARKPSGPPEENWANSSPAGFENNIVTLAGICRGQGIEPVFCVQAYDAEHHPRDNNELWVEAMKAYGASIRRLGEQQRFHVIDVDEPMSGGKAYFADFIHMTEAGNRERARVIMDGLNDLGLLDRR